eukprot:1157837-Pelagomonas_calceolata.AAC.11
MGVMMGRAEKIEQGKSGGTRQDRLPGQSHVQQACCSAHAIFLMILADRSANCCGGYPSRMHDAAHKNNRGSKRMKGTQHFLVATVSLPLTCAGCCLW